MANRTCTVPTHSASLRRASSTARRDTRSTVSAVLRWPRAAWTGGSSLGGSSGPSPTPSAWSATPTCPCMRMTRSQRSASWVRVCAKGSAVRASASTTVASCENLGRPPVELSGPVGESMCLSSDREGISTPPWAEFVRCSIGAGGSPRVAAGRSPASAAAEPAGRREAVSCRPLAAQLARQVGDEAAVLGDHVVAMDRLEVLLARAHERTVPEPPHPLDREPEHLAHAVLDEPRARVRLLDHVGLVGALEQLVDLRAHRALDDRQQLLGADRPVGGVVGRAQPQRPEPALVVRGDRHRLEHPLDLLAVEPLGGEASARLAGGHGLPARARRHALRLGTDQPPRRPLHGAGRGERGTQLLVRRARRGPLAQLGVARTQPDLGAARALDVAHALGDARGQPVERGRRPDHRSLDRLVEARHVRAALVAAELDGAVDRDEQRPLGPLGAEPDDLLDARHAHLREGERGLRTVRLDVVAAVVRGESEVGHGDITIPTGRQPLPTVRGGIVRAPGSMSGEDRSGAVVEGELPTLLDSDELQLLIASGQERGYVRLEEVAACLAEVEVTREQVHALYAHLTEQGIELHAMDGKPVGAIEGAEDGRARVEDGPGERANDEAPELDLTVEPSLDSLRLYLRSIGRVGLLTSQQEVDLAARIERGDMAAKQHMIEANLRLVVSIAKG